MDPSISKKEVEIGKPILCVGNIVIGGAGKTPLVIKIRQLLSNDFSNIFVLTRGYLGEKKGPLIVKKNMHYKDVGDESLIHANYGSTCVSTYVKLAHEKRTKRRIPITVKR